MEGMRGAGGLTSRTDATISSACSLGRFPVMRPIPSPHNPTRTDTMRGLIDYI